MLITFYKAVLESTLVDNFIPGTVTTKYEEAYIWWERYSSKKKNIKGAGKHIQRGKAVIISFVYDTNLLANASEFQRPNVSEHNRLSCWTSEQKLKAQINTVIPKFEIILT